MTSPPESNTRLNAWRRLAICLSLANLLFIEAWVGLGNSVIANHLRDPISRQYSALLFDTFLIGLALFGVDSLMRRNGWKWAYRVEAVGLLLGIGFVLKHIRNLYAWPKLGPLVSEITRFGPLANWVVFLLLTAIAVLLAYFASLWRPLVRGSSTLLLWLTPYLAVNVWLTTTSFFRNDEFQDLHPISTVGASRSGSRVLWIIFDTLDYYYCFENRPKWLSLPNIDRFRSESVDFTNALSPAERTEKSIPALFIGEMVSDSDCNVPNHLELTLEGDRHTMFRNCTNLFQEAEAKGIRTAVCGFYIPYGRLLGDDVTKCVWYQWPTEFPDDGPWLRIAFEHLAWVFGKPFTTDQMLERQIEMHKTQAAAAEQLATDRRFGLTFVHFFPPHAPGIFDAAKGKFTLSEMNDPNFYENNLALTDRTLGELREAMEKAGTWKDTLVLVTADHSWRHASDFGFPVHLRIPFLCHFPGQKQRVEVTDPMNTLASHDFILDYLAGELQQPTEFISWMSRWTLEHPNVPTHRRQASTVGKIVPAPVSLIYPRK